MKRTRIVDKELLKVVRGLPCIACSSLDPGAARLGMEGNRNHPHHVVSRGAGGHDIATNLITLCARHHMEIHRIGNAAMASRYPAVKDWMEAAGHLSKN